MSSKKYSNKQKRKQDYESESEEEDQYEVEKIIESRYNPKTKQKEYLVKWENWPMEDSTWEPYEHLSNVKDIVQAFEKKQKKVEVQSATQNSPSTGPLTRINALKEGPKKRGLSMTASNSKSLPHEEEIALSKEEFKKQAIKKFQSSTSRRKSVSSQSDSHSQEDQQEGVKGGKNDGFEEPNNAESDETELVFEEIIDKRTNEDDGQVEYLIRFQNISQPQWVEVTQLIAIKDDVMAFEEKLAKEAAEKVKAAKEVSKQKSAKEATSNQNNTNTRTNYHQSQQQQQQDNTENDELEDDKDSKKRNLIPLSKRNTARRSQPFTQDEDKEKSSASNNNNAVANQSQSNPKGGNMPEKEQQQVNQPGVQKSNLRNAPQIQNSVVQSSQSMTPTSSSNTFELLSKVQSLNQKRKPIELTEIPTGDFKTDNVDRVELIGDFTDIITSRFEVFWKLRSGNVTPASQVYSASYLRRYEPQVLIDYLLSHTNSAQVGNAHQPTH